MFRSYNTIQAHPINQGEPELFYGLSTMTGCSAQEHPAWFASNSSYRSSFYFLIGNLYDDTTSSGITQRIRYFSFTLAIDILFFVIVLYMRTFFPSSVSGGEKKVSRFFILKSGILTFNANNTYNKPESPFFYHLLLSSQRLLVLFHQLLDGLNAESSTMAKLACFHEPQCTIWLI